MCSVPATQCASLSNCARVRISLYGLLAASLLLAFSCRAGAEALYIRLKSFGDPLLSGREPLGELIEGTNGVLYGTTRLGGLEGDGTVFRVDKSGGNYLVLHGFTGSTDDGMNPEAGLIQATDGLLFGTTSSGGTNGFGTIFRLDTNGNDYSVLRGFAGGTEDGADPSARLLQAGDGRIYGTTRFGGASDAGTVFVLNEDGTGFSFLHSFGSTTNDGKYPYAGLIEGHDGVLYGTTSEGGVDGVGVIFSMNKDGTGYSVLHYFAGSDSEGSNPHGRLFQVPDGRLFGSTFSGRLFRINTNGTGFFPLSLGTGRYPECGLVQGSDGALYGTTSAGGAHNFGVVYRLPATGLSASVLHDFTAVGADGYAPEAALLNASDGRLYGVTTHGSGSFGTIFRISTNGADYAVLHLFSLTGEDGGHPNPLLAVNGWIYGTTENGGSNAYGTVFRLKQDGSEYEMLRSFQTYATSSFAGDGRAPRAGLLVGSDGLLYGTTSQGGSNLFGTVFKINTNGTDYQIVRSFVAGSNEVQMPEARLVEGVDGALYGTGSGVPIGSGWPFTNYGGIFKINKDGSGYTVLHVFAGQPGDGRHPSGLVRGSDDYFYGVTGEGGNNGEGTVFKLSKDGISFSVLHHFPASAGDGENPGAVIEGSDGLLYGTTVYGGSYGEYGTIFRLKKDGGDYTVLKSMSGGPGDPHTLSLGLIEGPDGYLYVPTRFGGVNGCGALIRMARDGTDYRVVLDFSPSPYRFTHGLVFGSDGGLYGASEDGGDMDMGELFKLFPPPEISSAMRLPNGVFHLTVRGLPGAMYRIEGSTDLREWASLTNVSSQTNSFEFFDQSARDLPSRLYRAVWLP